MSDNNLKDIWQKIDFEKSCDIELNEEKITDMLKGKTHDIFSRLGKNIKIGFGLLGIYIILSAISFYYAYIDPESVIFDITGKTYLMIFDFLLEGFLIFTFIYFVYKYNQIDKSAISTANLKSVISEVIKTLSTYKKLFYYGFAITMTGMVFGFIVGTQRGLEIAAQEYQQTNGGEFPVLKYYLISTLFGVVFIGGILLLIYFVFKKLYGKYLGQLQDFYRELTETE